jgi:Ca2+-binding EF-hand superfamily protein
MLRIALLAGLALVIAGTAARAGDEQKPAKKGNPESLFKKLDANGDGKVSKEEFAKFAENNPKAKEKPGATDKIFSKLDTNGDGSLSFEEFKMLAERKKKDK